MKVIRARQAQPCMKRRRQINLKDRIVKTQRGWVHQACYVKDSAAVAVGQP